MTFSRYRIPILFLATLLFVGFACQLTTNSSATSANDAANQETVEAEVAATMAARNAGETAVTTVTNLPAIELESQLIEIYKLANPAVVHIFVFDSTGILLGTGTGFVIDSDGHIVTNNHVVENGASLEIVFSSGERRAAEIAGTDVDSDLAVISVTDLPSGVQPLVLGDSGDLVVGQFVIAIGNPFGEESSMSVGIVSGLGRTLESQRVVSGGRFSIPQVIQTDAAINPGNSGGPLLNLKGEVVGVNSAIISQTGANSGVGYSIPVNAVRNIAPALIENGHYIYPYMGVSMIPEPFSLQQLEILGLPPNGVYVSGVEPDTPAEAAGLIGHNLSQSFTAEGDYITAINGEPVKNSDELLSYLVFETQPGETVNLTVIRDGEEINVPLTLGERP